MQLNDHKLRVRTCVQHCDRRVKEYGDVSHLWRHECWMFPIVTKLFSFLAQRHIQISRVICVVNKHYVISLYQMKLLCLFQGLYSVFY